MYKKIVSLVLVLSIVIINLGFMMAPRTVTAAGSITAFSDTVTTLNANAAANHTIQFTTPTGIASGQTVILTFDNSTLIDAALTYADVDFRYGSTDVTLAATPSGATMGVARTSGTILTFTNGTTAISGGTVIIIKVGTNTTIGGVGTKQITNGPAGSTILRISGTFTDYGSLAMAIVANSVVAVTAEVLSTLSFAVSSNALYFGNLSTTNNCFARNTVVGYVTCPVTTEAEAFNITAATNATTGYTISVQGDTLTSGVNTITPLASNTTPTFGTEQFGLRATATGGSGSVSVPYAATGFAYTGTVSTPATLATSNVPSLTTTYSVRYLANIASITEAGSYATNHTYVATGNF